MDPAREGEMLRQQHLAAAATIEQEQHQQSLQYAAQHSSKIGSSGGVVGGVLSEQGSVATPSAPAVGAWIKLETSWGVVRLARDPLRKRTILRLLLMW